MLIHDTEAAGLPLSVRRGHSASLKESVKGHEVPNSSTAMDCKGVHKAPS